MCLATEIGARLPTLLAQEIEERLDTIGGGDRAAAVAAVFRLGVSLLSRSAVDVHSYERGCIPASIASLTATEPLGTTEKQTPVYRRQTRLL